MKQSHIWQEIVDSQCPYCRYMNKDWDQGEGDIIRCDNCGKDYELGEQK
ncbi:hypothetical protein LCGC14_0743230 [marine sediment metagenome]|uniref:Uncharacterized protein n=1 Tax=marine sediment metagenome TaxID=412755 RepID=A0A0F9TD70_9ZZZZ